jgi:hypothetical protein
MTEIVVPKARAHANWTTAERAEWLVQFERSGQSAAEVLSQHVICPRTRGSSGASKLDLNPARNPRSLRFRYRA